VLFLSVREFCKFCHLNQLLKIEFDGGPNKNKLVLMDWFTPLSSKWNQEAISVLSLGFLQAIKNGEVRSVKSDPDIKLEDVQIICLKKHKKTRTLFKHVIQMSTEAIEERLKCWTRGTAQIPTDTG
jgi:hypothetical protein